MPSRWLPFPLRLRWAQVRSTCVRRRVTVRVVRIVVIVAMVWIWAEATTAAKEAQTEWASVEIAIVAAESLAVGDNITDGMVRVESSPSFLVPTDVLTEIPVGAVMATSRERGEILSARDLQSTRVQSLLLRATDRAIGIPIDDATPTVHPGDLVELLLVTTDPMTGGVATRDGAVLAVHDASITVAVAADDADAIAAVLVEGAVVVALRHPG